MFEISRPDGRSNQQVVVDHVHDKMPGTLFSFSELCDLLERDTQQQFTSARIGAVVRHANGRLLKEHKRELSSVRGEGYRLALAREHRGLATTRERKADRQIALGLRTLQNVRLDEMTENERQAHLGHLMVTSGLASQIQLIREREEARDEAIASIQTKIQELTTRKDS